MGPNFVLDKGFRTTGTLPYTFGEPVRLVPGGDGTTIERVTAAGEANVIGIVQESIDAEKVETGKAIINIRMLGISRVIADGVIALGARVATTANTRVAAQARAIAGAQPAPVVGIALTPAAAAGDHIDVLLTPGATY